MVEGNWMSSEEGVKSFGVFKKFCLGIELLSSIEQKKAIYRVKGGFLNYRN